MKSILIIVMFFAFLMGASGLAKALDAHNSLSPQTETISQLNLSPQEHRNKCCSGEEVKSDKQSPRCIGDICLQMPNNKPNLFGFGNKLPIMISTYIGIGLQTSFLRPPIA